MLTCYNLRTMKDFCFFFALLLECQILHWASVSKCAECFTPNQTEQKWNCFQPTFCCPKEKIVRMNRISGTGNRKGRISGQLCNYVNKDTETRHFLEMCHRFTVVYYDLRRIKNKFVKSIKKYSIDFRFLLLTNSPKQTKRSLMKG